MLDIQKGERFFWNSSSWAFSHAEENKEILWFERDDGKMSDIAEFDLMVGFQRGTHKHDRAYKGGRIKKTENLLTQIQCFSEYQISIAWARLKYVEAILAAGKPKSMATTWQAIIASISVPFPLLKEPSWSSVNRWLGRYLSACQSALNRDPISASKGDPL